MRRWVLPLTGLLLFAGLGCISADEKSVDLPTSTGLAVGTRAPAFDVTNVVTEETLCYV